MRKIGYLFLVLYLILNTYIFAQDTEIIVAKVNDTAITLRDLSGEIEKYNEVFVNDRPISYGSLTIGNPTSPYPSLPWSLKLILILKGEKGRYQRISSFEDKMAFLKEVMVPGTTLYQEAIRRNLDKREDIKTMLFNKSENEIRGILIMALIEEEMAGVVATDEEVRRYLESASVSNEERRVLSEARWDYVKISFLIVKQHWAIRDLIAKITKEVKIEIFKGNIE